MKKLFQLLIFLLPISVNANDDYVDLGLPSGLLWATCNLGAESPEQYGNYYDWDKNPVQEYWRGSWRTPTKEECDELVYNCMRSVETINGIKGARYTGSNGNSIFFPFAGYYQKGAGPYKVGEGGQYWTITPYNDKEHWILATNHSIQADDNAYYWPLTYFSFPVRPVISRNLSENVIVINKENFPDDNFRTYLNKQTYGQDGIITEEEIGNILYIEVHDNISNLKGIEYFKALKLLNCSNNHLTNIDVSKNTALTSLNCYHNQLTSIDISKNTALTAFWCSENQLTNLDVSKNTKLDTLVCTYNQLTDLDCSNNTALTSLWCNANYLTRLDVSKSYALTSLDCHANKLTILDVSKNVALIRLDCYKNQLTSLDVSKNTMLTWLSCYNNQLTNLDVSKNIALTFLSCSNNQLVNLDISNNTALTSLSCDNNQLI